MSDNLGRSIIYTLNVLTTFVTITYVGGWPFLVAALVIFSFYVDSMCALPTSINLALTKFYQQLPGLATSLVAFSLDSNHHFLQVYSQTSRDMRRLGKNDPALLEVVSLT